MNQAERTAAIGIGITALLGVVFAFAGADGGESLGGLKSFTVLTLIAFGINIAVFIPSYLSRTDHYYDVTVVMVSSREI